MGKGKPRHNVDKQQNNYGKWCPYYEEYKNGKTGCGIGLGKIEVCKGNKHNCIKCKYKNIAIKNK